MTNNKAKVSLNSLVKISPYYQRSVRLNDDYGQIDAVKGYVCHETARKVLANMAQQVAGANQRAFTWTGPYGSGKSSLALALTTAISNDGQLRELAEHLLPLSDITQFNEAFAVTSKGWLILPIVGGNYSISTELARVIKEKTGNESTDSQCVLKNLRLLASSSEYDGVALVIDEMGKFLEASSFDGDDIYFFQELAELSSRTQGNFLLVGILHQAFRQYAKFQRFSEQTQNEWEKVQGRFCDIPLVASTDEVIELLGNAISQSDSHKITSGIYQHVCECLQQRRPLLSDNLESKLKQCWPLHPITALLLGPVSRRQFGQNERSVFGFLGSLEAYGFQEFLRSMPASEESLYTPENYWDYLKANLEPAITASNDSHRWAIASEAVERAEARGTQLHASIVKNIAIIDLFKNGSGLAADSKLLSSIYPSLTEDGLNSTLSELAKWKIIIFRKFNDAWSIFEGSDFDIESAIAEEKNQLTGFDPTSVSEIASFHPIVAKRHLYQTGTLRWMKFSIVSSLLLDKQIKHFHPTSSEFGQFLLVADEDGSALPDALKNNQSAPFVVGATDSKNSILELAKEITVLKKVGERPELEGDSVGKKEVSLRLSAVKHKLEIELSQTIKHAVWYSSLSPDGNQTNSLSKLASDLADQTFSKAPKIWSELVNREKLSSSSVKARKDLLYKMLAHEKEQELGIEKFPAEKGLYLTCLKATGLHKQDITTKKWSFCEPKDPTRNMLPAWKAAFELVSSSEDQVSCTEIYNLWGKAPFGIKAGIMPILMWSLILSCKEKLALYKDSRYVPQPSELDIDLMLQNASRFELKGVQLTEERITLLSKTSEVLSKTLGIDVPQDPLSTARGLVKIIYTLPKWVRTTRTVSREAQRFRDCILRASDPHKVLFHDIQGIYHSTDASIIAHKLAKSIDELQQALPNMLGELRQVLHTQLAAEGAIEQLNCRAANISGTSDDLMLNGLINRLKLYDGTDEELADILYSLTSKPLDDWNDQDVRLARNRIALTAQQFRELEVIASVNKRNHARDAIAIVYGSPGKDFVKNFDIGADEQDEQREALSKEVLQKLSAANLDRNSQFAVLAHVLESLYQEEE